MCTEDLNKTIKLMVARGGESPIGYSSHSAKATLLAWAASWGLDFRIRAMLGYHTLKSEGVVRAYARGKLEEPVRQLCQMTKAIADSVWNPDARVPPVRKETTPAIDQELIPEHDKWWSQDISPTATFAPLGAGEQISRLLVT